jgi:ABC-2 type transport system ATP-binding protein
MIHVKKVYKSIKQKKLLASRLEILKDVSFCVPEGKIVSIIGQNGAGKSTIIKTILGFTVPDSGTIDLREGVRIGYLPENAYYYDYLSFRELLWFSASSFGMKKADFIVKAERAAKQVGMHTELNRRLRTFSKGMTQRAGLAAAIVHDPELLIFDEPMSGLDPFGRQMVFDLMIDLRSRGKTILFCSHILSDVERLCDEVIIMHSGEVRRNLSRADIFLAQKGVEILVEYSSQNEETLRMAGCQIKKLPEHLCVYVDAGKLNHILAILHSKSISVANIQSSDITLESIFNDIVAQ